MALHSPNEPLSLESIPPVAVRAWAPRDGIAPRLSGDLGTLLRVESNGSDGCFGGWELVYPAGETGDHFAFSVKVRWSDTRDGFESLAAEAMWTNDHGASIDWAPIREWDVEDGWVTLHGLIGNLSGAKTLVIKLLIRWTATGFVEWKEPVLAPASPPEPRIIRLGAGSSRLPTHTQVTLESNRDRFLEVCRRAGREGVNLLCLPETIFSWGLAKEAGRLKELAVEIPGGHIEPFQKVAQEFRMAIGFSVLELDGELVYNTAVLINESGEIADTYRKVHLATPYEMWQGVSPGNRFSVARIETAGAKVGMNICMDSSAAESARAVARLGGEVLLLPIMGDHRADRWTRGRPQYDVQRWIMIQQMRAMDNHLYLVAARNEGIGSGVFAPDGTTLVMDGGDRPIVWADVDLNDLKRSWTGATFKDICWHERRESTYGILSGDLLPRLRRGAS